MLPDRAEIIKALLNEDTVKKVQKQVDPSARKLFNESDFEGEASFEGSRVSSSAAC